MTALASLASRPDLDTMVAHISPEDAEFLLRRGGAGQGNPRTGMPQFWSDGGGDDSDSRGGERRGGRSDGISDTERGTRDSLSRGVSNVDATRAAQSTGYGNMRDAMSRGYGLTSDALADARGWGMSVGDTISKVGGGYGYGADPAGMAGFKSNAQAGFANSLFGGSPQQSTDLAAASPGLMSAMSSQQQYGAPKMAASPLAQPQMKAAIPQQTPTTTFRANYPQQTNNPFGIMNPKTGTLASYATPKAADLAFEGVLQNKRYAGKPIDSVVRTYVGKVDPTAQETYVKNVEKWTGMPRDTTFDPSNPAHMSAMKSAIMRQESGGDYGAWSGGLR